MSIFGESVSVNQKDNLFRGNGFLVNRNFSEIGTLPPKIVAGLKLLRLDFATWFIKVNAVMMYNVSQTIFLLTIK